MAHNLAEYTQEEIIKAVTIIQDICKSNAQCFGCPFYPNGECIINEVEPCGWEINGTTAWRAFL